VTRKLSVSVRFRAAQANTFQDIEHKSITWLSEEEVNFSEFECCTFNNCNFRAMCICFGTFIDCTFNDCTFSNAKINYVAFRTVTFNKCEIKDVNFAMCDKLILKLRLRIALDFSKFYT
jgi:uncharacterized protein YjbI with pentapeptide repeats